VGKCYKSVMMLMMVGVHSDDNNNIIIYFSIQDSNLLNWRESLVPGNYLAELDSNESVIAK